MADGFFTVVYLEATKRVQDSAFEALFGGLPRA